jgi:hypothetical protein
VFSPDVVELLRLMTIYEENTGEALTKAREVLGREIPHGDSLSDIFLYDMTLDGEVQPECLSFAEFALGSSLVSNWFFSPAFGIGLVTPLPLRRIFLLMLRDIHQIIYHCHPNREAESMERLRSCLLTLTEMEVSLLMMLEAKGKVKDFLNELFPNHIILPRDMWPMEVLMRMMFHPSTLFEDSYPVLFIVGDSFNAALHIFMDDKVLVNHLFTEPPFSYVSCTFIPYSLYTRKVLNGKRFPFLCS